MTYLICKVVNVRLASLLWIWSFPVADFRHVLTLPGNVLFVVNQFVAYKLFQTGCLVTRLGYPVDKIADQVKPVKIIQYRYIKWRGCCAFFFITTHLKIYVIGATVWRTMDETVIAMKGEDDGLINGIQSQRPGP